MNPENLFVAHSDVSTCEQKASHEILLVYNQKPFALLFDLRTSSRLITVLGPLKHLGPMCFLGIATLEVSARLL